MWNEVDTYVDILTEFIFNGCNSLMGGMVVNGQAPGQGQALNFTKTSLIVAVIAGLIGAANHVRALRKQPRPGGMELRPGGQA